MTEPALQQLHQGVQRAFSAAASTYDAGASVQLASARSLLSMVPTDRVVREAMDLGCGTVPLARPFIERFPESHWLAVDVSPGMLQEAAERGRLTDRIEPLCAAAESLPLADGCLDLVFSSFALQWCETPQTALAEVARVLRPGAVAAICVPVSGTLQELQQSWAAVDASVHVNNMAGMNAWLQAAQACGLAALQSQQLQVMEHYTDVRAVAAMLKTTGANCVRQRHKGLVTPSRFAAMERHYESLRDEQGLPLTWAVAYLLLEKP